MMTPARCSRNVVSRYNDTSVASSDAEAACGIPEIHHVKRERFGTTSLAIATSIPPKELTWCAIARPDLTGRGADLVYAGAAGCLLAIAAAAARPRCAIALLDQPRPVGIAWRGCAAPVAAFALPRPVLRASKLASQLPGATWVGGSVEGATAPQPRHNHQTHGIARFSDRLCRLSRQPSRVMRMRTRASARTCRGSEKTTTTTTTSQIKVFQGVGGCEAVVVRLCVTTTAAALGDNGGFLRVSNILAAGYWASDPIRCADLAGSTGSGSRAGETFGVSADGWRAIGVACVVQLLDLVPNGLELGTIRATGGNGGFLRVSARVRIVVGRAMLEGCPQRRGNTGVAALGRKPVRLAQGLELLALVAIGADQAAPADRAEAPPYAPIRARRSPAHAGARACRNLDRLRPSIIPGARRRVAGRRQTRSGSIGSGSGNAPGHLAAAMGRGLGAKRMSWKLIGLRRAPDVTRSAAHVN